MANTIRIKRSTGSSNPTSLENAEVAFREGDEVLVYGKGTGGSGGSATSIIPIGGKGAFFDKATVQNANKVLAGPASGSDAAPAFRALVAADVPSLAHTKISDFDTGVQANRLDQLTAPTSAVSANNQKITNLATPTSSGDAASKSYVDSVSQGLDVKDSCKAATTANITLSGTQTIDGISISAGDRVLVKDQSTASQNGIYICSASAWSRSTDLATGANAAGAFAFIEQGSTFGDVGFVCSTNTGSAVVGTNSLAFTQFSGVAGATAGNGLTKTGNQFDIDLKANGGLVFESTKIAVDLAASSITGTLGIADGGTGATSASAARTALGLAIGTNVQAFDAQLSDIAGLSPTDSNFIVGNGSNFVLESGATARASLGVAIGSSVQAYDADLDNLSGCQSGGSAALAALTEAEIQILDGATVTTAELNILDGVTSTTAELNILDGVTSTTAELNLLDGVTSTTAELNLLDGATSATSTTLAAADRIIVNDNGTMKQVAFTDLVTFLENGAVSGLDIDGGSY